MKAWVCSGCWLLSDGEYESVWARADDDTKRVNDPERFAAEQAAKSERE
jgi:hypothetical protein